jgi:hypothetical protein
VIAAKDAPADEAAPLDRPGGRLPLRRRPRGSGRRHPVLGHLFRNTHAEERKTNLVVLLTPYVLADPLDRARSVDRVLARRSEVLGALERLDGMHMRPHPDGTRLRGLSPRSTARSGRPSKRRPSSTASTSRPPSPPARSTDWCVGGFAP